VNFEDTELESDSTVLRLSLLTFGTFVLAGVGLIVSANSQTPVAANPHRLSGQIIAQQAESVLLQQGLHIQRAHLQPKAMVRSRALASTQHHPEHVFSDASTGLDQANIAKESKAEVKPILSNEQLKRNALSALRGSPNYFPSDTEYESAVAKINKRIETQQLEINVKTFLLSQYISNDSRLAELQMQPFFAEFDHSTFSAEQDTQSQNTTYTGVGFPHIERNSRSAANRYKPYKQLMSFSDDTDGDVVPYVKCMGLSPERVAKRASKYDAQIAKLSVKHDVSASLIKAVVAKESCFNPKARSPVGAIGLMQLMPETARWLKVKQPENPEQNLAAGVRYLAQLRTRFGEDELALAAYNAGPGNVERYNGIPPFDETENYVVDVMHFYRGYAATSSYVDSQNQFYYP